MQYNAIHRYADMSPRKIRPFATLIRGRTAEEALDVLSGIVWDQNTKVFDVGVDKKIFLSKNRDNGTNL